MPNSLKSFRLFLAVSVAPGWVALVLLAYGGRISAPVAALGALLVLVVALLVAWLMVRQLTRLRDRIFRLRDHVAYDGTELGGWGAIGALNDALRQQTRHWAADRADLEQRVAAMDHLFDAFPHPLLTIGDDRRVELANRAARTLLAGAPDAEVAGMALASLLRPPEVTDAVGIVLEGGEAQAVEFAMSENVERHFEAHVSSIAPARDRRVRALLVLQDVTKARRTERMRVDFLANVSHELRTPLSTLVGFIETLRGPARDDTEARERFLSLMEAQTARMARLVNDLLSLSRIEMDEHTAPTETVDITSILSQVAEILSLPAGDKEIRIEVDIPDDLPELPGDSDQLTQLFQNLIDNAIKYGRPASVIRVRGSVATLAGGPAVMVSVADQGEGIPAQHIPRLTERFYRVDAGRSRERGGTGLGLAIVKHVVNRHRGHLRIRSTPGEGSVFTVLLPASAVSGG